jgi:hypothetical protein
MAARSLPSVLCRRLDVFSDNRDPRREAGADKRFVLNHLSKEIGCRPAPRPAATSTRPAGAVVGNWLSWPREARRMRSVSRFRSPHRGLRGYIARSAVTSWGASSVEASSLLRHYVPADRTGHHECQRRNRYQDRRLMSPCLAGDRVSGLPVAPFVRVSISA